MPLELLTYRTGKLLELDYFRVSDPKSIPSI